MVFFLFSITFLQMSSTVLLSSMTNLNSLPSMLPNCNCRGVAICTPVSKLHVLFILISDSVKEWISDWTLDYGPVTKVLSDSPDLQLHESVDFSSWRGSSLDSAVGVGGGPSVKNASQTNEKAHYLRITPFRHGSETSSPAARALPEFGMTAEQPLSRTNTQRMHFRQSKRQRGGSRSTPRQYTQRTHTGRFSLDSLEATQRTVHGSLRSSGPRCMSRNWVCEGFSVTMS